ncbi:Uncharacterized protein Adt_08975 [Abeliophyllum distichum]|uniref:Uncharacterized protein n=1 Tax=Abeliophyllum distichum TaxID=126358 RepID=A0ABD1UFW0_9LAMI
MPLNGKKLWPPIDREPLRPPAWHVPRRGRRQKKRRLQPEELVVNQRGGTSKMKKHGTVTMTCSICGLTGHNKRYHDKHDTPQQDWLGPDAASQTMSQKSASTAKGKLQPRRSKKSASTSTCEPAPPEFHFMPTPGFIPATSDMYTTIGPDPDVQLVGMENANLSELMNEVQSQSFYFDNMVDDLQ